MLTDRMPAALDRIEKKIKELCGIKYKYIYLFDTPRQVEFEDWTQKQQRTENNIIRLFQKELQPLCKTRFIDDIVWDVKYHPSEKRALYLIFYAFGKELYGHY